MQNDFQKPRGSDSASTSGYAARSEILQRRVNAAAQAMSEKGIRPTVARIRAALGGGSPNDLAPALKHWKETVGSAMSLGETDNDALPRMPIQIADLAQELWQRANAAAEVELKGGAVARTVTMRKEEVESLRIQVSGLRDQLQRESLAFGESRAQAARYEAMAHTALARADEAEARERKHLRELGTSRQRIAELKATIDQLRERRPSVPPRRVRLPLTKMRRLNLIKARTKKTPRIAKAARRKSKIAARVTAPQRRGVRRRTR